MALSHSPKIVTSGLVFTYDTGDGKSYKGEPTQNLAPSGDRTASTALARQSYHQETWSYSLLTNTLGRADIIRLYIDPSGNTSQPYADFGFNAYKSGGSQVGDVYSISFDYYVAKNTNTPSCIIAYQNGYKSPSSASIATLGSETTVDLGGGWKRVTRTATITTAGTTWWRFGLSSDNNETEVYVDNFQVELKSHATPFVDGTRSATQGLLDRTGNKTIDLSDMSFDSNAQMDFDGSGYISIPTHTFGNGNWTLNAWVNPDVVSGYNVMSNSSSGPVTNAFGFNGGKIVYRNYDGAWQWHHGNTTMSIYNWYMLTWVNYEGASASDGTMKMYVNGVADSDTFNSYTTNGGPCDVIGRNWTSARYDGRISSVNIYNKSLSDAEVLQNYNAIKGRFNL